MDRTEMHALRNIMQAIAGFAELGMLDKVKESVRDANKIMGHEGSNVPWTGARQTIDGPEGMRLSVEMQPPGETIFIGLETPRGQAGMALPCGIIRSFAYLLLGYCAVRPLPRKDDPPGPIE